MKEEEKEVEPRPTCPACGSLMIRAKKYLKAARVEVEVWVCPAMRTNSCTD